ncbi:hypothetical protein Tco_1079538 [Tanacetum coccineum]|uniref:Uncharacterized protein n=1 Tax=Tanacetum coccineum TaxID=301880 RepID=A0ABQ5HS28_9ASTR
MQKESVSKQGRKSAKAESSVHKDPLLMSFDDEKLIIWTLSTAHDVGEVLLNMSQAKAVSREKEKGVEFKDVIPEAKKKFKQLVSDEEMARKKELRLIGLLCSENASREEKRQFTVEERAKFLHDTIVAQRRFLAQQISESIRNKPPTKNQLRNQMMTYLKHVGNFQHSHLKTKKLRNTALYENDKKSDEDFIAIRSAEDERRIKEMNEGVKDTDQKRLKEENIEKVPAKVEVTEQGTIDSEIMERKSVITRLNKVSSPDGDYLVIYRANGNFRAFNYLLEVLHIFDRQDLFHLYELVMKQYSEVTMEGIELILWGDLKIMMESSKEENDQSDFWNNQQNWEIVTWRLYEACGVYILELEDGTVIHMLVERRYPLSKDLMQRMLDFGLEVEIESTVALDLIRFIKQQLNEEVLNSPCFMVKSWLVQDQTVLGKDYSNLLIADSLLKTIWFINAPCYGNEALASPKANELTIPEQTATGKGKSNPFMASSLPKTTKPT